jgi:hypothetical protein
MKRRRVAWLAAVVAVPVLWAMFAPIPADSREQLFEIPAGTWERRAAGHDVEILPAEIHLTLGVKDILVLRNLDRVPQTFGPVLIMPGQSFKLPFGQASDYQFNCTAHAAGRMDIIVDPEPAAGWRRLAWRVQTARRVLAERRRSS